MKINLTSSWHISHKAWHKPIWLGWLLVLQYRKSNRFSTLLLSTFLSSAYPRSDLVKNLAIFFSAVKYVHEKHKSPLINVILPHHSICSKIKCEVIHFSQSKSITFFLSYHYFFLNILEPHLLFLFFSIFHLKLFLSIYFCIIWETYYSHYPEFWVIFQHFYAF